MAKLGWRLKQEEHSLWAQVLLRKYSHSEHGSYGGVSNAWKRIMAAKTIVENGLIKVVRNVHGTKFWMDTWIGEQPLYSMMRAPVSLLELYASVREYWDETQGWKWDHLQDLLPTPVANRLRSIILSTDTDDEDEFR